MGRLYEERQPGIKCSSGASPWVGTQTPPRSQIERSLFYKLIKIDKASDGWHHGIGLARLVRQQCNI